MTLGISKTVLQSAPVTFGLLGIFGQLDVPVSYDRFFSNPVGASDTVLYTVPKGMRAFVQMVIWNNAGTTTTWYPEVQIAGVGIYNRLQANTATNTKLKGAANLGIAFEAGDVIAINTSQTGLNVWGLVTLFPNTSRLRTVKVSSAAWAAATTIYTATKKTLITGGLSQLFNTGTNPLDYVNSSGSTATISWNLVESGNLASGNNEIDNNNGATVATGTTAGAATTFYMAPGDFVVFNTNQTGQQLIWLTVIEGI